MKMWSIKVIILMLFCYAHPFTGKVYFVSENFNNTLQWDPVESEGKVLYSVQYKSDDVDQFQIKKECQNITALSCDLTAETASFYDVQYEARVFVNNACYGKTTRFKPLAETIFGPPKLSINTAASSLLVNVTLPLGPDGVSIANIINRSTNGHSKSVIIYTLNITEPKWAALVRTNTSTRFVISLKDNHAKYCGYVVYKPLSEWGRSESQKAFFCAELPGDYRKLLPWFIIGAALPAAIAMILGLYMWNYAKGGKQIRMPESLVINLPSEQSVRQDPFEKLSISKAITVCTTNKAYAANPVKGPSVGSEGYSPQNLTFQDCTGSSMDTDEQSPTLNSQDTSVQSYSVVAVHVPTDQNENIQQPLADIPTNYHPQLVFSGETWNAAGMVLTLATSQNLDATGGNSAKPLMRDIVRNADGQLMLSSLVSLLQSRRGDEAPSLPSERRSLLSDLIDTKMEEPLLASLQSVDSSEWSDSGCDDSNINTPTIYSPPQAIFESGYKQNWIPVILLGDVSQDNFNHLKNFP